MHTQCLLNNNLDPFFNLATEEYLLKNFTDDFFIIWRSERSVVVGKHQNALSEINHRFVRENNIHVARRLSGGGTVFHDPGNVNFTFIRTVGEISEVNFNLFTRPIVESLKKLGVHSYTTGRNDLLVDNKKISGNAEHVYRKRVLHHGTLLFNSDLSSLKGALNVDLSRFEDRSVQSNRSEVTNIAGYLEKRMDVETFAGFIFNDIANSFPSFGFFNLSEADTAAISQLRNEKYQQWHWIYGYSPRYIFRNNIDSEGKKIAVEMSVVKGIIQEVKLDGFDAYTNQQLAMALSGKQHRIEDFTELTTKFAWLERLLF